ncbi:hypothetical protein HU200_060429 [Digitaria exilis]|uniref:Uncharacterized protein n=1 Tax=Digitaria exilis TaxID=1010633 RepID=A0A835A6H6_9POAL|nr:hypothetical protein HU200_060429 [Digitaria exilis]
MLGMAAVCWSLWKARNNNCFENKKIRSPTEIICSVSSFLSYWAGAEVLKNTALHLHPQQASPADSGTVLLN